MTRMVDAQNAGDPNYVLMADDLEENVAYNAGLNLVLQRNETLAGGRNVERALHEGRRAKKTK
jgi:malate synthase